MRREKRRDRDAHSGKTGRHIGRMACEHGGRDWNDAAAN